MAIRSDGNVKWVNGLRGIASIIVVISHVFRAFDPDLLKSLPDENQPVRFLQLPLIRIIGHGHLGVIIFAFVTGYVCGLKPIRLSLQGNNSDACKSLAGSALRRVPRLVLPAALVTGAVWFLAEFNAFAVARQTENFWLGYTSPSPEPSARLALYRLTKALLRTWMYGDNEYDQNQWAMPALLRCSTEIYLFSLATVLLRQRYRLLAAVAMIAYYWAKNDAMFGIIPYWGVLMADLQHCDALATMLAVRRQATLAVSVVLLFLGLLMASFPIEHAEWVIWARLELNLLWAITPSGSDVINFSAALGFMLITVGLHLNPSLCDLLSGRRLLWLAKYSFAVYLLHGPLLRTVLVWMVYGFQLPSPMKNEDGTWSPGVLPYPGHKFLLPSLVVWLPMTYGLAVPWTNYVEACCGVWTEKLISHMKPKNEKQASQLSLLPTTAMMA